MNPLKLNVYDLPTVDNVCNQILREVSLPFSDVSMAHVSMGIGNTSLMHKHESMEEIYYILKGEGVLCVGEGSYKVGKGSYLEIPKNTPHMLSNLGQGILEHLVFACPPFNPDDVHMVDFEANPAIEVLDNRREAVEAQDGAIVYELDDMETRSRRRFGLASGVLPKGKRAIPHYHRRADEVYYVIDGGGNINLNGSRSMVIPGMVVFVPRGVVHGLESSNEALEVLCLSCPDYDDGDMFVPERVLDSIKPIS